MFDSKTVQAIAAISERGRLVFAIGEIKHLVGRDKGVIVMGLDEGEYLVVAAAVGTESVVVAGIGRGGKVD